MFKRASEFLSCTGAATLLLALLGLASSLSYAGGVPRHILIDFGYSSPTVGTNDANGEAWQINPGTRDPLDQDGVSAVGCVLDFSSTTATATSSGPVSLGFDVNLNGVIYKQVHVNQNGVVTFSKALGTYAPVTDFASLQTVVGAGNPFIAAFYPGTTALSIPPAANPADMGFDGGAEYGRGLANPTGTDVGTSPDIDGDVPAFKASWFECPAGSSNTNCVTFPTNPVEARIVLYNRFDGTSATHDGDFDLRFEYDSVYDTGSTAGGQYGVVGFSLGSIANTVNLSGSSTVPTAVPGLIDIYYQFRNGVLVGAVTSVSVPNVVNDTLADATTAITAAGLVVGSTATQSSPTVPSGSVISQNPAAGTSEASGSAVNLVLSSGPAPVAVPNVVNMTLAAATSTLKAAGLVVGTTTQQASTVVPAGSVISENPAAGTKVAVGSAVNLVLSSGPATVTVPSVVNDTLAAATAALSSAGLKLGSTTRHSSSSVPAGSVISQSPAAGVSVATGSAVNLVISTGALRGDVNGDGQVDILDLVAILEAFGQKVGPGDPRDLNGDRVINLKDAAILVSLCTNVGCAIRSGHPH
jgi:beta-lactam-binding protein with PASTA domain